LNVKEIYDSGYFFPCPQRDAEGRRVIINTSKNLNTEKFTYSDIVKTCTYVLFACMEEEETQISGFVYVFDHKDISFDFIKLINLNDAKNHILCIQNSMPGRQKKGVVMNLPTFATTLFQMMMSFASKKLQDRAFFLPDDSKLADNIDINILPKEYGGKIPKQQMIDEFRKTLIKVSPKLKEIDAMSIDESFLKNCGATEEELGSFRKLDID
jgi:CRAL/TRIO domain